MRFMVGQRGHEYDRNVHGPGIGMQMLDHLEAIHARHHHIEQYQLWVVLPGHFDGLVSIARFDYLDAFLQHC